MVLLMSLLIQFRISQYAQENSAGFTICTHTTSLTFDLTSDQEQLPKNRMKPFHRKKRRKKPSGEQQRRIPLHPSATNIMSSN